MITLGVDVHKRQCTVAIQRDDGELKFLVFLALERAPTLRNIGKVPQTFWETKVSDTSF